AIRPGGRRRGGDRGRDLVSPPGASDHDRGRRRGGAPARGPLMEAQKRFTGSPEFPVEVEDPAVLEVTWERDDMHMPFPLTPLAADYIRRILGASFNHHYARFGGAQTIEARVWHGYAYFAFSWGVPA